MRSVYRREYQAFLDLLTEARNQQGLTQEEVASRLGRHQSFVSKYERAQRHLDIAEFIEVAKALRIDPNYVIAQVTSESKIPEQHILDDWEISPFALTELVADNPSLRGILLGYVAEYKFQEIWLGHPDITDSFKYDDHDRKGKGDRVINYKGQQFIIEVKSLQSNTVHFEDGRWSGKAQVDASDSRMITLPSGNEISTTLLIAGEFDVLAVNLFAFGGEWRFVFAKNKDLPRSTYYKYAEEDRQYLLTSLINISWPAEPPMRRDLYEVLDELIEEKHI